MEREKWQRRSGKLICAAIILLGIYVVLKYALGVLIPFIIAYFVASPMVSLADKSSKKFKGSRKAWGIFYILVFWGFIFLMIYVFVAKIISQASDFFDYISKNGDQVKGILKNIVQSIVSLPSRIPFLKNVIEGDSLGNVGQKIGDIMGKAFASLVQKAGEIVGVGITKVAFGTPKAIISLVVCVVSSFYLVIDSEEIKDYLLNIFHFESRERIKRGLLKISLGFRGYVKAYFFLFLITFTELYVGLAVLGRKYSFFIAAVVATLDLLPLFGSGLVLVPWAIALIIGEVLCRIRRQMLRCRVRCRE